MPTPPGQPVVDCTIELREVEPRVWRRLLVPGSVRLDKLHRMFQAAMGWEDYHLHSFDIGAERYGMQLDDYPDEELQEKDFTVVTAIGTNERFGYEYDFGDSWEHRVVVEKIERDVPRTDLPVCLEGERAAPPEDCGGIGAFYRTLEIVADRRAPEHLEMKEWLGEYEPETFDLDAVNAGLRGL